LKIVLATHHFPPKYVGGVELIVRRAARWLTRNGRQVQVVCVESIDQPSTKGLEVSADQYEGITVYRLSFDRGATGDPFRESFRNPIIGQWFEGFLRANLPDIVHIHSSYLLSGSVIEAAKTVGIPTVVSLHDYHFFCSRTTLLRPDGSRCPGPQDPAVCAWCLRTEQRRYRLPDRVSGGILGRLVQGALRSPQIAKAIGWQDQIDSLVERRRYLGEGLASADVLITQARMVYEIMLDQGLSEALLRLVPYGLDLSGWESLGPADLEGQNGRLRIGYLGSLIPAKGAHVLISAFRRLRVTDIQPELKLHGSMAVLPRYVRRLKELAGDDPRITFAGRYENSDVARILGEIDVLVVPSLWYEIGPLVTMEALASKTPVVVGDIPNMKYQVMDGVDGLHYSVDSVADLARKLQRLLDEPGLVSRLASGIQDVRTSDQELSEWLEIYESVVGGN
jgi:glycosyltransferase involved in cell wall biosynthesis